MKAAAGGAPAEKSGRGRGDDARPGRSREERVRERPGGASSEVDAAGGAAPRRAAGGGLAPEEGAALGGAQGGDGGLRDDGRLELLEGQMLEAARRGDFGAARVLKPEVQRLRAMELERLGAELQRLGGLERQLAQDLEGALARVEEIRAAQAELPEALARAEELRAAQHRLREKLGMSVEDDGVPVPAEGAVGGDGELGAEPGAEDDAEGGREGAGGGAGRVDSEL
ncbi:unnamed protein product [Prorocentrum cordatum]|uniref:Uncharacterized protein n=1 Tax=Prorocentrum cordatum TaxID=2364126 RepID=A0ABN9S822_9DINO|nr:unnamed protein product [Polarella glacialis]